VRKPPAEGNFCYELEEFINLPLLKTAVDTWLMLPKGTELPVAVHLFKEHRMVDFYG
jgi:hypothetical protein